MQSISLTQKVSPFQLSMADPSCSIQFDNPGEGYRFRQNLVAFMLPAFCGLIALIHLVSSLLM